MKRKLVFSLFIFCVSLAGFSQKNTVLDSLKVPPLIDTLFIDRDINNWSIRIFTKYSDQRFRLSNDDQKLNYIPNNPFSIGIGIATKKLLLDFGFNIKGNNEDITKRFDIQANILLSKHFFDFSLQRYQGYNVENDFGAVSDFRNDLSSLSTGLNYMYLFNARKYSLVSENSGLSRQNKTAVTFGLGGFLIIKNILADSSFVPSNEFGTFNEEAHLEKLFGMGAGIHGIFSVIFPLPYHFFTSFSVTPGIGLMLKNVETEFTSYTPSDPMLYKMEMAGAFGYNGDRIYLTIRLGFDFYKTDLDNGNKAVFNTTHAKLAFGYKLGKKH